MVSHDDSALAVSILYEPDVAPIRKYPFPLSFQRTISTEALSPVNDEGKIMRRDSVRLRIKPQ